MLGPMTKRYEGRAARRKQLTLSVARSALSAALMLVVYYRAPFEHALDAAVLMWLLAGLGALAVALVVQIRLIVRSDTPRLRALEAVAIGLPFLLLLYASTYTLMSTNSPDSFTEALDRTDALYFTMTVFSTIGFGDIAPVTHAARIVTMSQMVVGLLTIGLAARLLITAVNVADGRKEQRSNDATTDVEDR
jgi:voltage-gated potassium channel